MGFQRETALSNPTREAYAELEQAYAHFNARLFNNRLPHCLITFQRQHDTYGYFSANQFVSRGDGSHAHEIALNPTYFAVRSIPETLSVLVREMVTLDQHLNSTGRIPRRRYRNKEWGDMAEQIGLMPSDTGRPGGKRVGDKVKTYIIEGGPFDLACAELVDENFTLSWLDRFPPQDGLESGGDEAGSGAGTLETTPLLLEPEPPSMTEVGAYPGAAVASDLSPAESEDVADERASSSALAPGATERDQPKPPPMKVYAPVDETVLKQLGVEPKSPTRNLSKSKFTCPACGANAWGKPSLQLACLGKDATTPHDSTRMVSVNYSQPSALMPSQ